MNTFQTHTGHTIYVRPIQPEDTDLLIDLFHNMSSDSRYQRFNTPADNISSERIHDEAERIAKLSPDQQHGLFALIKKESLEDDVYTAVGAGRYVRLSDPTTAEFAMSVRDDYQQQGIGQTLLHLLIAQAQASGLQALISHVRNSNKAAFALLQHVTVPFTRQPDGDATTITLHLTDATGAAS